MKIIVGLGNPGRKYEGTPHNAGFEVINEIARENGLKMKKSWRFPIESAQFSVEQQTVLLVKPQTFMNRSGDAIAPLLRKKGVAISDVLVLVDDVELPLGKLRLRASGSAGTHNGLKSLIERLGSKEFARLRMGVGPVPTDRELVAYVLAKYSPEAREQVREQVPRAVDAVRAWVCDGVEKTMNEFNR